MSRSCRRQTGRSVRTNGRRGGTTMNYCCRRLARAAQAITSKSHSDLLLWRSQEEARIVACKYVDARHKQTYMSIVCIGLPRHRFCFSKKIRCCWTRDFPTVSPGGNESVQFYHEGLSCHVTLTIREISSPCRCEAVIGDSCFAAAAIGCLVEAFCAESPGGRSKSARGASVIVNQAETYEPPQPVRFATNVTRGKERGTVPARREYSAYELRAGVWVAPTHDQKTKKQNSGANLKCQETSTFLPNAPPSS